MSFCFFSWFFKNCELIKDSFLWCSNFIPSVRDSVIIIGSRSVTYTFDSHFIYKLWVKVSIKIWILAFLGKYSNIICWVSKRVDWGSHQVSIVWDGLVRLSHTRIFPNLEPTIKIIFLPNGNNLSLRICYKNAFLVWANE